MEGNNSILRDNDRRKSRKEHGVTYCIRVEAGVHRYHILCRRSSPDLRREKDLYQIVREGSVWKGYATSLAY